MNVTYDMQKMMEWMQDFYALTKIKTAVYDNDFRYILGVPQEDSAFCTAVKTDRLSQCDRCTKTAIEVVRQTNALYIYKCHAGLTEAIAPIRKNGVIVGYMMLGQILETQGALPTCAGDLSSLTTKSHAEIVAASKILESGVCYLLMNHVIQESAGGIAFELSDYIKGNIGTRLTAAALCQRFHISRNALYHISETYFGMPISQYINYTRIELAKTLIQDGVSVTKVAEMTGFCDYGYFGKVFKKLTGTTPTQIKRS